MDLDTRPPEMQGSTMHLWIQECPHCGYVSDEICDETTITPEYLKSEEYLTCNGINMKSDLAKRFYKFYMLSMKKNDPKEAFYASLHAAWASDDANDVKTANICRKQCVELISEIDDDTMKPTLVVMKSDLLRRMGCFDKVISEYSGMRLEEDLLQEIIKFEVEKAKEKDSSVYRIEDVEEEDSHN